MVPFPLHLLEAPGDLLPLLTMRTWWNSGKQSSQKCRAPDDWVPLEFLSLSIIHTELSAVVTSGSGSPAQALVAVEVLALVSYISP